MVNERAGRRGPYDEPTQPCPYCGEECEADWVDIGIGVTQCGPYHCDGCGASEIGPEKKDGTFTELERKTGWYGSGHPPSPHANTIKGTLVDHRTAKLAYEVGLLDPNPSGSKRS